MRKHVREGQAVEIKHFLCPKAPSIFYTPDDWAEYIRLYPNTSLHCAVLGNAAAVSSAKRNDPAPAHVNCPAPEILEKKIGIVFAHSQEDIDNLKQDWAEDPYWDIEDTEGFKEHRDELLDYSIKMNKEWGRILNSSKAAQLGLLSNPSLSKYICHMEKRIDKLESLVEELSGIVKNFGA